jgi:glutamate 5-kinase
MSERQALTRARRIVVKLGTRALMGDDHDVDRATLSRRLEELVRARQEGRFVVLVSSGAIGLGWTRLGFPKRPATMPELQACASVGQSYLMRTYNELLAPLHVQAGQLLLTHEDFRDRRRYLNLRNCLAALHESGALPVVNENDSVAVDEIRFGDNDILTGLVANAIDADLAVLFSDVEGVFDGETKLSVVREVEGGLDRLVRKSTSGFGSGGMASKLSAARTITSGGGAMVVAHGKRDSLDDILAGREVGTLFLPAQERIEQRKRWIAFSTREAGVLQVDAGAEVAILRRGKSLLPAGVTGCEGDFEVGDAVVVRSVEGRPIAKGLTNYSADELRKIMGRKTDEVSKLLGYKFYDEVIHRDNLVSLVRE